MIQVAGQQLAKAHYPTHASATRLAEVSPVQRQPESSQGAASPKFGGWGMNGLSRFYEKMNTEFVWNFIVFDIVALALVRGLQGLRAGRIAYDAAAHPEDQQLSPQQRLRKEIKETFKGLNWPNFTEIMSRELLTGPGLIAIPSLGFMVGRNFFRTRPMEVSAGSLRGLCQGFQKELGDFNGSGATGREEYRKKLSAYVQSVFADPQMKSTDGHEAYLTKWADDWTSALFSSDKAKRADEMTKLEENLAQKLKEFNQKHRSLPYDLGAGIADDAPLHKVNKAWVLYAPTVDGKKVELKQKDLSQVTKELNRWSDLPLKIWEHHEKNIAAAKSSSLASAIEQEMKRVVSNKLLFSTALTLISGVYLIKLAFWSQSHEEYAETRLLKLKSHGKHSKPAMPSPQGASSSPALMPNPMALNATFANQSMYQKPVGVSGDAFNRFVAPNPAMTASPFQAAPVAFSGKRGA